MKSDFMKTSGKMPGAPMLQILMVNLRIAAWVSLAVGLAVLFTAIDNEPLLQEKDVVIGLSSRVLLLIGAVLMCGLGYYLFSCRDLVTRGLAILWMVLNFVVYRVGLAWMRADVPCPVVTLTGWKLGIQPATLDICWKAITAYFAIGGISLVIYHGLQRKRSKAAEWQQTFEAYKSK